MIAGFGKRLLQLVHRVSSHRSSYRNERVAAARLRQELVWVYTRSIAWTASMHKGAAQYLGESSTCE